MSALVSCKRPPCKVIDFASVRREKERRRRERLYYLMAIVPQRLSLASLVLYGLLRLLFAADVPFSYYIGPLTLLWPAAFFFLLISYISDLFLWEE